MNLKTQCQEENPDQEEYTLYELFVWSSRTGWSKLWWQRQQCLLVGGWENNSKNEGAFCVNENVPYLDCGNGYTENTFIITPQILHMFTAFACHSSTKRELIFLKFSSVLNVWIQPILKVKTSIGDNREEMLLVL